MIPPPACAPWSRSTNWLDAQLGRVDLAVVDASYHLGDPARAREEYLAAHIPGAVFFEIDAIADRTTDLPHMLPDAETFSRAIETLGISDGDTIVVYDGKGLFSAPRVWWTFRVLGAERVFILEGGLPAWRAAGYPLEAGVVERPAGSFHAKLDAAAVASREDVRRALGDRSAQVVDARSADRFAGRAPEPRPGIRSGHMPGAFNVPFSELIQDGRLAPAPVLVRAFEQAGVDIDRPIIASCGSGMTAVVLAVALEALGKPLPRIYDGSWTEWASYQGSEIEPL